MFFYYEYLISLQFATHFEFPKKKHCHFHSWSVQPYYEKKKLSISNNIPGQLSFFISEATFRFPESQYCYFHQNFHLSHLSWLNQTFNLFYVANSIWKFSLSLFLEAHWPLSYTSSSNARVTSWKSLTSTLLVDSKHPFAVHLPKPGSHHQSICYPLFFQIIQKSIWINPHNLLDFEIVAVRCRREDWSRMP